MGHESATGKSSLKHQVKSSERVPNRTESTPNQDANGFAEAFTQENIIQLQRLIGNRAVQRQLNSSLTTGTNTAFVQRAFATVEDLNDADNSTNPIKARKNYKTVPQSGSVVDETEAQGRGVDKGNASLTTSITWKDGETDGDGDVDGKEMTANPIGPDHQMGSTPGKSKDGSWESRRIKLSKVAGNHKYIAGHLLNHELGGPGNVDENLAAIPDEVNKAHSRLIEQPVKKAVNEEGKWGYYHVKMTHEDDPNKPTVKYASRLEAQWHPYALKHTSTGPKFREAKGEQISVNLPILPPSTLEGMKAKKKTKLTPARKKVPYQINDKAAKTITLKAKGRSPVTTVPGFDELVLTVDAFYLAEVTRPNVVLIKKLQEEKQDTALEIIELKALTNKYLQEKKDLQERIDELEDEIEENEIESYKVDQERKLERQLNEELQKQVEELKEKLKKAQGTGLFMTSLFTSPELFETLGKEGALFDFGLPSETKEWGQIYNELQPTPKKKKRKSSSKSLRSDPSSSTPKKSNLTSSTPSDKRKRDDTNLKVSKSKKVKKSPQTTPTLSQPTPIVNNNTPSTSISQHLKKPKKLTSLSQYTSPTPSKPTGLIKKSANLQIYPGVRALIELHIKHGKSFFIRSTTDPNVVSEFKKLYLNFSGLNFDDYRAYDRELLNRWSNAPAINIIKLTTF